MAQQQQVTLPWNQASITALATAIQGGVLTVEYENRRVTYRNLGEMLALLDRMTRYVVSQGDGVGPVNVRGSVFIQR